MWPDEVLFTSKRAMIVFLKAWVTFIYILRPVLPGTELPQSCISFQYMNFYCVPLSSADSL